MPEETDKETYEKDRFSQRRQSVFFTGSEESGISHFYRKWDLLYYNNSQCDNITYIT